ncbi:hypothetical protein [Luteimonas sp. R10]|uniref:hypothetical protein n=1 Tax=Luteimonas sp. R10 TaxID=3108176 RepID=UPI00308A2E92|nr:hypothetical protein U3649_04360 [Luteimonas sp. R10]
MPIEAILIKPVVDALLALFRQADDITLKRNAEAAIREAIRELLQANPNESRTEARIGIAKAAGILSEDVVLAEAMLDKHRATRARTRGKAATGRRRKPAEAAAPPGVADPKKKAPARRKAGPAPGRGRSHPTPP